MEDNAKVSTDSPSVHTHLSILQSVISRMAANSASCKSWCIGLVSAVIVVMADKEISMLVWTAVVPTLLFFFLDSYYLALEKSYRDAYNSFVHKIHVTGIFTDDLFSVVPSGNFCKHYLQSISSPSTFPLYLTLLLLVFFSWSYLFC